jgi:hypothetical protein
MSYGEAARLRQDDEAFRDDLVRQDQPGVGGAACAILQTTTQTSYPTAAGRVYQCLLMVATGTEVEGSSATIDGAGRTVKALNLGSGVPPSGTNVLGTFVPYMWTFRYP